MRVALCISGDFRPASNVIAAAAQHILPDGAIDVFVSLWTPPGIGEAELRAWITPQLNARMTLKRWTFDTVRQLHEWDKFVDKSGSNAAYVQDVERLEIALQLVCQLKAEEERISGTDYDAVVRLESHIRLDQAPPLAQFQSILDDHVVIGRPNIMPWWPAHDFRVAMMSSRNMEVYSAIHTLHRRQYLLRYKTIAIDQAFVNHFHHAQLKTLSVPVAYSGC